MAGGSSDGVRRGVVLGGGGVLGAAWMVGALTALEERLGVPVTSFDYLVGTSAGSILAALLGAGVTVDELRDHQLGRPGRFADVWDHDTATGGSMPLRPRLRAGSPRLLTHNLRRLRQLPPTALVSALVPEGRGSVRQIGRLIESVAPGGGWVDRDGVWIVAMDYETGRRVPLGRPGEPEAGLADAVMASCAIPGWFEPTVIGGHRFVDGGACSATSVDLLAGRGLDEVYVVAPMVSFELDHPTAVAARLERRWRSRVTRRCLHEVAKVEAEGVRVTVLGPGPDDLEAIGANVMDTTRRLRVIETSIRTSAEALTRADERAITGEITTEAGTGPGR